MRAESYFAMGAQLMVQTNDWLSPHAPDEPVLNKPPLQYWLTGIGYRLFGASYTTARLPSAFAALCLLMLVYLLCSRLYEKRAALLAVGCLMTSYLFFIFSRTAMSDMLFTMCVSASLSCFILIMTEKSARVEKPAALCGYLFLALGVLAKGPLAVVLVAGPLAIELIISRDFSMLKRLRIFSGTLVFLTVAAPYFLLLYLKMGVEPLRSFFIGENLQRFTGAIYMYASVPFWHLLLAFLSNFAPWSLLLFPAIFFDWRTRRSEPEELRARRLVYLWLFFPLVFFSFSHFKLDYYLLPSMPAAALIAGRFLSRATLLSRTARASIYTFAILFALLALAASLISMKIAAALLYSTGPEWLLVALAIGAFLFLLYSIYKDRTHGAIWSLIFCLWCALLLYSWMIVPALSRYQPVERLAKSVPATALHVYTSYAASNWANALAFQLPPGTKVTRLVSDRDGAELKQALEHEPNAVALIKDEEYERLLACGVPLRSLAEGETMGHGGVSMKLLEKPLVERLRVVQGYSQAGGK